MRNGPPQTCRYVEEPEPSLSGRVGLIKKLAVHTSNLQTGIISKAMDRGPSAALEQKS